MSAAAPAPTEGPRVTFASGGTPDEAVLAAIVAVVTRPVVVVPSRQEDEQDTGPSQSAWVRAARLEGIVHGRRIATRADLTWRRSGHGSA